MPMGNGMHFDIHWADLNPAIGREQAGHRPVLIISNDIENRLDVVTVIPVTSRKKGRRIYPNEVLITLLNKEAIILCHQVRTISKKRIGKKIGHLPADKQRSVINSLCRRFE